MSLPPPLTSCFTYYLTKQPNVGSFYFDLPEIRWFWLYNFQHTGNNMMSSLMFPSNSAEVTHRVLLCLSRPVYHWLVSLSPSVNLTLLLASTHHLALVIPSSRHRLSRKNSNCTYVIPNRHFVTTEEKRAGSNPILSVPILNIFAGGLKCNANPISANETQLDAPYVIHQQSVTAFITSFCFPSVLPEDHLHWHHKKLNEIKQWPLGKRTGVSSTN